MSTKAGPARAFEGMRTPTTVAQQEVIIREELDKLRKKWDHGPAGNGGGLYSSRSAQLSVRQELGVDGSWERIFDLLVARVVHK